MLDEVSAPTGLFTDDTQVARGVWCRATPQYQHYHDTEWGMPVGDDNHLFEKICLEGFQAGLSWLTILKNAKPFGWRFADLRSTGLLCLMKTTSNAWCWTPASFGTRVRLRQLSTTPGGPRKCDKSSAPWPSTSGSLSQKPAPVQTRSPIKLWVG